jgi:hypothetical protein
VPHLVVCCTCGPVAVGPLALRTDREWIAPGQPRCAGRLHTTYHQSATATGRLSSSSPNLQNIPVKGQLGSRVREAFVAPQGRMLASAGG